MSALPSEQNLDINKGVTAFLETEGAVLLDVRTEQEYRDEHIPNSTNMPLNALPKLMDIVPDKNTPLFTYCLSGARSERAKKALEKFGYVNVTNIGGILSYEGETESGAR